MLSNNNVVPQNTLKTWLSKLALGLSLAVGVSQVQASSDTEKPGFEWKNSEQRFQLTPETLKQQWPLLHQEDQYPFPDVAMIQQRLENSKQLQEQHPELLDNTEAQTQLAEKIQAGWILYHQGQLQQAHQTAQQLGSFGQLISANARYLNAYYQPAEAAKRLGFFKDLADELDQAMDAEPKNTGLHFMYCYVQGRFLEEQAFKTKLIPATSKLFSRVNDLLEVHPEHLGGKLILAGFHAEGSVKAPFLAKMRYGSSAKKSKKQFTEILQQHPDTAIGQLNYAISLWKMNDKEWSEPALKALQHTTNLQPYDLNSLLAQQKAASLLQNLTAER